MKKKQLVCSTLAAAMLMSSAVPGAGAARFSDVGGHWGESSINRWGSTGVIVGTDGRINPNGSITRGEMASIIAEMLGLEEMAPNVYPDLNGGWYSDAMLKCAAAGIMTGDDHGRMRPYDNITGAEIAVIFNKALNLSASVSTRPTSATGYVKPWAQGYVDQLALRGIAVGNDGGTFQPMNDTSRAAVISMFDRAVDTYITSPGTYQARGITVVNTPGTVTLTGAPGSIDITQRASGGRVYLDHTTVGGTIKIHGGRTTLTAQHASLNGDVQVVGYANTVNIDGTTSAGVIQLGSDAGTSRVSIGSSARAGSIISDAASSEISVSGTVNNIQLSTNAVSARVDVRTGAKVENVTSNANSVIVSGSGTLRRADIYGAGNRVTTPHTTVSTDRYARSYTVRKNSTPSRYYYGTSDRHLVRFYFDDDMDDLVDSVRVRDGEKVDKSDIKTPRRNGYRFDGWEYGDYYGRYYDSRYDRYYDWYYDDYYYDIDDWYRSRDYEWDSHERAYYNSYAKVYYDDYKDKYFVLDGHDRRDYLTLSELRDRYRRYYRDDYYDDWRYDHYYDHYYGESFSFSDRIYSSVNLYATWVRDKDYDYDDDTVYTASQASTKLKNELGSLSNVAVSGTNVTVTGTGNDGSVTDSDIDDIARQLLYIGQHLESGTTLYVNSHAVGSATTRSDIVNWIKGARADLNVLAAAPSVPGDTTVLIQDGSGNPPTYKISYKAGNAKPEEKPDPTPDEKTPEQNAVAEFENALGSGDADPAKVKAAIEAAEAVEGVTVIVKLNGQESSAAAIGELNPAESEVDFEVTVVIGKTTKTCTIKGTKKELTDEEKAIAAFAEKYSSGSITITTEGQLNDLKKELEGVGVANALSDVSIPDVGGVDVTETVTVGGEKYTVTVKAPEDSENTGTTSGSGEQIKDDEQTDGESGGQTDGESGGQTDGEDETPEPEA